MSSIADLIQSKRLSAHFQPIVALHDASIYAHEALIRTPPACPWRSPDALFLAARAEGKTVALEVECIKVVIGAWVRQKPQGKLFVNISPTTMLQYFDEHGFQETFEQIRGAGMSPSALVIELTEHEQVRDVGPLVSIGAELRKLGINLALDDFGDGRSSLRLWSELKPEVVKIDKYFMRQVATHGDKLQVLRALIQIAETFGSTLVAEGLEHEAELRIARDLGIRFGQGYILGRPAAQMTQAVPSRAAAVLEGLDVAVFPELRRASNQGATAARLLVAAPSFPMETTHNEVFAIFARQPALPGIVIVDGERPIALINQVQFTSLMAKPYFRELYGKKPARLHGNTDPLLVDVHTNIENLTTVLTSGDQRYLTEGFVIVESNRYMGLGTGEQLVRAVTEARIEAARHANPLTFLPGNVPITTHIGRLIGSKRSFIACYADLNHFKPFNDHYGYWRGDEMIRLLARTISKFADPQRDFVGHVGGDDFVMLFQSDDWESRCEDLVKEFDVRARDLFDATALNCGGIEAEDRYGQMRFYPFTTLSVGAVSVRTGQAHAPEDVASAAATAKRMAKSKNQGVYLMDLEGAVEQFSGLGSLQSDIANAHRTESLVGTKDVRFL